MKSYLLLSDAILDGAKLSNQAIASFVNAKGHTCALGAAIHAISGLKNGDIRILAEKFENILDERGVCPVALCDYSNQSPLTVFSLIMHLNDRHRWSREQIAAFVATVEERLGLCEIISDEVEQGVKELSFVTVKATRNS